MNEPEITPIWIKENFLLLQKLDKIFWILSFVWFVLALLLIEIGANHWWSIGIIYLSIFVLLATIGFFFYIRTHHSRIKQQIEELAQGLKAENLYEFLYATENNEYFFQCWYILTMLYPKKLAKLFPYANDYKMLNQALVYSSTSAQIEEQYLEVCYKLCKFLGNPFTSSLCVDEVEPEGNIPVLEE